ncbi:MAG: hypothetical protein GAK41_01165 [Burkholderia gladioli]|nr:MAG: hypothetical protein GAK41_01165 [Burkholderia gladioli]
MATTRPRVASSASSLTQASPIVNSSISAAPHSARSTAQTTRSAVTCIAAVAAATVSTDTTIDSRAPKRRVSQVTNGTIARPPPACAAVSMPTTPVPWPDSVSASAVNGKVAPVPRPTTATLRISARKSRVRIVFIGRDATPGAGFGP